MRGSFAFVLIVAALLVAACGEDEQPTSRPAARATPQAS
jgi:hypothetical protein